MRPDVRIVPVLLLKDGNLVRSSHFTNHRVLGDPLHQVERFNSWLIDEIVMLNISSLNSSSCTRRDVKHDGVFDLAGIQKSVAERCIVPLTWGGNLRTLRDVDLAFQNGAEKVLLTTALFDSPKLISTTAERYGSQAVSIGIDYREEASSRSVVTKFGTVAQALDIDGAIRKAIDLGAGEIVLHAVDRDGSGSGYDSKLILDVTQWVPIPVVALGGARTPEDFVLPIKHGASAVAAGNMWHFSDNVDVKVRQALTHAGYRVRKT